MVFASKSRTRKKDFFTLSAWFKSLFYIVQLPRHTVLALAAKITVAQNVELKNDEFVKSYYRYILVPIQNIFSCSLEESLWLVEAYFT